MAKEKVNLYLLAIVAIVAVVGIVVLILNAGETVYISEEDATGQAVMSMCTQICSSSSAYQQYNAINQQDCVNKCCAKNPGYCTGSSTGIIKVRRIRQVSSIF